MQNCSCVNWPNQMLSTTYSICQYLNESCLCYLVFLIQYIHTIQADVYVRNNYPVSVKDPQLFVNKCKDSINDVFARNPKVQRQTLQCNNNNMLASKTPPGMKRINPHAWNRKLLDILGFIKIRGPNNHNRKRLAIETRRYKSSDDSHMFIIKLPPNLYYYSNPKEDIYTTRNTMLTSFESPEKDKEMLNNNERKVPLFPFNGNGKPLGIHHWNLPIINKLLSKQQRVEKKFKKNQFMLKTIDKEHLKLANFWERETYKLNHSKLFKQKSPSYYAPAVGVNKNSFNRYFSGNGKLNSFFVIGGNHGKANHNTAKLTFSN